MPIPELGPVAPGVLVGLSELRKVFGTIMDGMPRAFETKVLFMVDKPRLWGE